MENIKLISNKDEIRIDKYIVDNLENHSRSQIQKLIKNEAILVNGKTISKNYKVSSGDLIEISIPEPELLEVVAENIPLNIVYEDDDLFVINKEQGMVVHPAPGHYSGTMVNALMNETEKLSSINGVLRPGIVHRLDKNTSGLMIVAKTDYAHQILSDNLKEHSINRYYYALVEGRFHDDDGVINFPLGRSDRDRKKRAVTFKGGKEAVTTYEVLERYRAYTLLKIKLKTGRTHQIRVHMKYIGHPVVGDEIYGRRERQFGLKGQLLHSRTLGFIHPRTGEYMEFECDLPDYFKEVIKKVENQR